MAYRSDHAACNACCLVTTVAGMVQCGDGFARSWYICADCAVAALEAATPWKWAGVLASYRAGAAVKAALDNNRTGRKPGPHARKRAKEVSDGRPL